MKEPTVQHELELQWLGAYLATQPRVPRVFGYQSWSGLVTVDGDSDCAGDHGSSRHRFAGSATPPAQLVQSRVR